MNKPNPQVTRYDVPALRRPPLAERLPRLHGAPEIVCCIDPGAQTLIGEIPAIPAKKATRVPANRWLLLTIALSTLAYSMRVDLPKSTPSRRSAPSTAMPTSITSSSLSTSRFAMATAPEPNAGLSAQLRTPWDVTALETAAARAWFAGRSDEAVRHYEQLALLSPEASQYSAAAAILRSRTATQQPEPKP
jgi:hypothetical protein